MIKQDETVLNRDQIEIVPASPEHWIELVNEILERQGHINERIRE